MSNEKLSELSKPVAWVTMQPEFCDDERTVITNHIDAEKYSLDCYDLTQVYSQEYVSALLAELEAKDKRNAELERIIEGVDQLAIDGGWTARGMSEYAKSLEDRLEKWQELASNQLIKINELRDRLATPVRLPRPGFVTCSGERHYTYGADEVKGAISAAGFTVEGDEQ